MSARKMPAIVVLLLSFFILLFCHLPVSAATPETITFSVSGFANLYQDTNPETRTTMSIGPVAVSGACLYPGQKIYIAATGCVQDHGSTCTDSDGWDWWIFRNLPVYSLIGRWSHSPDVLNNATVASEPFFVGSNAVLTAPSAPGEYYLFLAENDGMFDDNAGAYTVTATWTPSQPLTENLSTESTLLETLISQKAVLDNVVVNGDFNGVLNFTDFEIVSIVTGPWADKGFSKGQCETTFEGAAYTGNWQGVIFLKPAERKIYIKGSISGEISATVEGYLTESVPNSNIYDKYQATWKIGRLGTTTTSATINLNGNLSYLNSDEFPNTQLYFLQTNTEGSVYGDYDSRLSAVINHLRITDGNSPYKGEGFSAISYVAENGSGQGWTYDKIISPGIVELNGLFDSPLFGIVSGYLNESGTPRTLTLNIARVDLGLPPAPDLKVKTWGPTRVSPGQTIDYIIEYRNDGLKAAENVMIFSVLNPSTKYISASSGVVYDEFYHEVAWDLGQIPPKTSKYLSIKTEIEWGLPFGTTLANSAYIVEGPSTEAQSQSLETFETSCEYPTGKMLYINGIQCIPGNIGWQTSRVFIRGKSLAMGKQGVWDPVYQKGLPWDIDDVINAASYVATVNNGLTDPNIINACYDVVYAYSGGTRTAVTAILLYNLRCEKLVLMSPIKGEPVSMEFYKNELDIILNAGYVKEIVIYQSESDKIPGSGRIEPTDPWLTGKQIQIIPVNHLGHGDWPLYVLNRQLDSLEQQASFSSTTVAVARDPSVKYGPEGRVLPWQELNYRIEYENEGEGIAFGVYFTDTLDEDLNDATLEIGPIIDVNTGLEIAPPGIYNPATRTITWFAGEVGPGQGGFSDVNVCVRSDANESTEIINYATIYFPSVPEETRTNGIVSIVLTNRPPVANAGPDQTVERISVAGAQVQLDGSDSNDPDGDTLTYEWTWSGGSASGAKPVIMLPMGLTTITITVSDGKLTDTDTVDITVVDTTGPTVNVVEPEANLAVQDGITLRAAASDISGVDGVYFSIREPNDGNGVPIGKENLAGTFNSSTGKWEYNFDTTQLQDGYYVVLAKGVDTYGNIGWSEVVPFSIRNWVIITMLPSTPNSKAGRTMPVKFSLRIARNVDPAMPFVYNEDLEIRIYKSTAPSVILQRSIFGTGSTNYRIDTVGEKYITNFKTLNNPAAYVVEIWRPAKNFKVGSFTFATTK